MGRSMRRGAMDGVVVFWCVFWFVIGGLVGYQVWQLSKLSDTLADSGQALDEAGDALVRFREVPFVGQDSEALGNRVKQTAAGIVADSDEAEGSVRRLSLLLGLSIALVPTLPLLAFYVPYRMRRRRDGADVHRMLAQEDHRAVEAYLAYRAIARQPYDELSRFTTTPAEDIRDGRHRGLADAELAFLGLRRRSKAGSRRDAPLDDVAER